MPEWFAPYRDRLEERRDELIAALRHRNERRAKAAAELAELQPALRAARDASRHYGKRIAAIEHELQAELRS
jgi:hypothetical protein